MRPRPLSFSGAVGRAGLDPTRFAGHSPRSELENTAGPNDVLELTSMRQTGHRCRKPLTGYMREGRRLRNNAARRVGPQTVQSATLHFMSISRLTVGRHGRSRRPATTSSKYSIACHDEAGE